MGLAVTNRRTDWLSFLPTEVWTLALLQIASAIGLAAMAAAPLDGAAPVGVYTVCSCALAACAAGLVVCGRRMGERMLLACLGLRIAVAAVTVGAAHSAGAALFGGAGLVWVGLWVTVFHPRRVVTFTAIAEGAAMLGAVIYNGDHARTLVDSIPTLTGAVLVSVLLSSVLGGLRHEARHDPLTGLLNRRGLERAMEALSSERRFAGAASLVLIDLDGLKEVNDCAGHHAGDQLIQTMASELQTGVRGVDLVARVGGDEFVAILPGLGSREAIAWAERLHRESGLAWSFGVAQRYSGEPLGSWLDRADELMYQAKAANRATRTRDSTPPIPVIAGV